MKRDEKLSTSVTEDEKLNFRLLAAGSGMNMSQALRTLVYDELERHDIETSRSDAEAQTERGLGNEECTDSEM